MPDKPHFPIGAGLVLVLLSFIALPAYAIELSPLAILSQEGIEHFFVGLIYGSLGILATYNISLFFTQRDTSSLVFLIYVVCIFVWFNSVLLEQHAYTVNAITPDTFTNFLPHEVLMIIPIASGGFLLTLTDNHISRDNVNAFLYQGLFALVLLTGALLGFESQSIISENTVLITMIVISSLGFSYISFQSIDTPSSPATFALFGFLIVLFYSMYCLIQQIANPSINTFFSLTSAFIFSLQAVFFTIALNFKEKLKLRQEIHEITDDLQSNLDFIEAQNVRLDIARKEALKASNIKSRFLANISHEIRTPLNAILGFSQELQKVELPPDKEDQINLVNIAAKNLHALVNDVLDFSKIEAGKLQIKEQEYLPLEFFEEIVEINAKSAQLKQLEFHYSLDNIPTKLEGDFLRLKQVITNLLSNALKFTDTGHISFSVVSNNLQNETVELIIKVDDTGTGISAKNKGKLFTAFSQVDDDVNRGYQGSGLGLAISHDIIKMMKGSISVVSEEGIGSSFLVKVQQKIVDDKRIYDNQSTFKNKRALIIDPSPESRRNTAALLKTVGMRTTSVESYQFLASMEKSSIPFDFCFLSLPQNKSLDRIHFLEQLEHLRLRKIVLLYSGFKPLEQYERFSSKVTKQIALPLTLTKLRSLSDVRQRNRVNPIQRKLQELPELSILAVDDMEINLRLLSTFLQKSKIQLTTVNSGKAALEHCSQHEYDLILMDIQMPGMDGVETTKYIRKNEINIGTPIIALTAHAFNEDKKHFLSSGFDDFLAKPIDLEGLINLIEIWCKQPDGLQLSQSKVVPLDNANIATIDWELAVKRANFNEVAARDLLSEFVIMLPKMIREIQGYHKASKVNSIHADVHKLHGACCYTGVPRLQRLCFEIESAFKTSQLHSLDSQLDVLATESSMVVENARELLASIQID